MWRTQRKRTMCYIDAVHCGEIRVEIEGIEGQELALDVEGTKVLYRNVAF